jgi:CDP-glycerol glycerophosphotransferase
MNNPMPLLSKCDLFVFPSLYEGFGLVLLEAESLNVPIVAANIPGPAYFMQEHGGYLCENSEEGILQGMRDYMAGKIKPMGVDFKEYNDKINREFEELMDK